jgi:branched-chain amino acid transport system ATP-binding protein
VSLRVHELTAGYDAGDVLRDVDLVVPRGRVVALLGANGAGKTTLLRCCSGLLAPRRGQVTVDGHDITGSRPAALGSLGLCHIPEGRAVFPTLTVAENLQLMADRRGGEAAERAVQAFPVLARKMGQVAGTMSGGEQQMLALARAYVTRPSFVLLDEVSMGLAPIIVDEIFDFLRRLTEDGVALLIVEQYVTKALALADLCYVLRNGRVAFAGEPSELDTDALARSYLGSGADEVALADTHQGATC